MYKRSMKLIVGSIALLLCVSLSLLAAEAEKDKAQGVQKTTTNDNYTWFTINNLFNWYGNNGNSSYNIATANSGLEYPKGTDQFPIFEDGVVWGGFHKGRSTPKVGGSTYRYSLQAGPVTGVGGPGENDRPPFADPADPKWKVYRVRPDVSPTTAFADVQAKMEEEATLISRYSATTAQAVFQNYQSDWTNWPAKDGFPAPFQDKNGNGTYEPTIDVPGQPGADQTLYYVANDLNAVRVQQFHSSPPIGLEMHRTVWGYNLSGALGNTIFASTLIINKSGAPLDSAYFVQWSDPDLGESGDDFAGCDVSRSLGYIYNGLNADNIYGSQVPAAGYDFFQGPLLFTGNPADSGLFQLKYRKGYVNMGMTTFVFFINGSAVYTDPTLGAVGSDVQWYRLMNGLISTSGAPFINPITNEPSKFTLDGDPVSGKGWLDGTYGLTPGDRRICLVTGPFTLANGDTQELVTATIVAQGSDRISSIAVLRWYSDLAQSSYDNQFNIPRPAPSPVLSYSELDGEISFSWPDSALTPEGYAKIETWNSAGYKFEGYNVWQLPSSSPDVTSGKLLATYDLKNSITTVFDDVYDDASGYVLTKPVQFGTDVGLKRTYSTTQDAIRGSRLLNGSTYYFGVSCYSFNPDPDAKPTQLESTPTVLTVIPQWPDPGTSFVKTTGDTLASVHTGPSDGKVFPIVVSPEQMTKEGASYKIIFKGPAGTGTWDLVRTWNGRTDTVARNIANQRADDLSPIVDGIQFRVIGAPLDFKNFLTVRNANGAISPFQQGCFSFNSSGFPLAPSGADRPNGTIQQSTGLSASQGWGIHTGMNSTTMTLSYDNFKSRVTQGATLWNDLIPYDFEIRFTAEGSKAINWYTDDAVFDVPFELWNIGISTPDNAADDYRLFPNILDVDGNKAFNFLAKPGTDTVDNGGGGATHSISGGANDPFTDWIYWVRPKNKAPGRAGYDAIVAEVVGGTYGGPTAGAAEKEVLRRLVIVGWNVGAVATGPGSYARQMPETGTVFRIITTKPNSSDDSFTITAPPVTASPELAEADAERVNVFPNPYIGYNPQEANKYERFVTFTHLPANATMRVFNLAGVLVRTLKKEGGGQFFQWNLQNEDGFPVAAGMYIVYIDMPDVGKTKILKLGVIPEQQFIDKW